MQYFLVIKKSVREILYICSILTATYFIAYQTSASSEAYSCLILIVVGLLLYLYESFINKNFLNSVGLFSFIWMCTIGLSQLRLIEYQKYWISNTWFLLYLAHLSYIIGNFISGKIFHRFKFTKKVKIIIKHLFVYNKNLYVTVLVFSYIGILSFIANVLIKGYVPAFISHLNQNAYSSFYTRFHIFYVASLPICGFSYFMIRKWKLNKNQKFLLYANIMIIMIIIPLMIVQRGTFLIAALILISAVYFSWDRNILSIIICILIIIPLFLLGTFLRGYTSEQLDHFFPQSTKIETQIMNEDDINVSITEEIPNTFQLPSKIAFIYAYLTVSHENFNSAVTNKYFSTYGIWQIKPFNVILRSEKINDLIAKAQYQTEQHMVRNYLNTFNLITFAFYDFGILGVLIFPLLWSLLFGLVEQMISVFNDPFSVTLYGVCLTPICMSFFEPWFSNFTLWLLFGSILLIFVIYIITPHHIELNQTTNSK